MTNSEERKQAWGGGGGEGERGGAVSPLKHSTCPEPRVALRIDPGRHSGCHMAKSNTSDTLHRAVVRPTSCPTCVIFHISFSSANFYLGENKKRKF